jgi:hypothetical protein
VSVINLNKARKARQRAEAQAKAEENRVRFGRTKAEKLKSSAEADRSARDLDGHRREDED